MIMEIMMAIIMKRKTIIDIRMKNLRTMSIEIVMIQESDTKEMKMKKRRKKKGTMKVIRIMNLMKTFKSVKVFNRIKDKKTLATIMKITIIIMNNKILITTLLSTMGILKLKTAMSKSKRKK